MEKTTSKKKWQKIVAISLAAVLVLGVGIWGLVELIKNGNQGKKYIPNWELAGKLNTRATNAQYLPDASKLVGDSAAQATDVSTNDVDRYLSGNSMTLTEYNSLINSIGSIWHPYQGDFHIQDVRDIVIYMSKNVGIFDEWFRYRGTNRSGSDFEGIPEGVADGDFYMTYDEETDHFRIIQCMGFQPHVWDADTGKTFWNGEEGERVKGPSSVNPRYQDNWPVMSEEVLIINYYYIGEGEDKKEVVEADIVNFLHVYDQTIITGYQKLKNIKDTSFTRYEIDCTKEGYGGINYKNVIETGVDWEILQIDYTDSQNVSILEFDDTIDHDSLIDFSAIVDGSKVNFTSYFKMNSERQISNTSRSKGSTDIGYVKDSFVSLLDSLTNSSTLSSTVDLSNTAENVYEQNVITKLYAAVEHVVNNSYLRQNYEQGFNIWDREAEDITELIHPEG